MNESIMSKAQLKNVALRINHRASNIEFYKKKLGFSKILEEGALTLFSDSDNKVEKLVLEETPAYRGRKTVDGFKKLHGLFFQVDNESEFNAVSKFAERMVISEKGKAAYFTSPEDDSIVLYTGEFPESEESQEQPQQELVGEVGKLTDFNLTKVKLNVSNLEQAIQKYEQIFDLNFQDNRLNFPFEKTFALELIESNGLELEGFVDEIWDIEFFEILLDSQDDLKALVEYFETQNLDYFVDVKQTVLAVKDASELEWWFVLK